jgi:hypothetical protein
MYLTEDEAGKRWCPMPRGPSDGAGLGIRWSDRCIASECMMWVWDERPQAPRELPWPWRTPCPATAGLGHCGLARQS